ncbi:hypothetical protein GE21DRAFT_1036641 [Neurospora crassa]|nr:hypothetical protein GE21DRAFT_1036641 [Neurospora crassa]
MIHERHIIPSSATHPIYLKNSKKKKQKSSSSGKQLVAAASGHSPALVTTSTNTMLEDPFPSIPTKLRPDNLNKTADYCTKEWEQRSPLP